LGLDLVFLLRPYWFKRGLMALGFGLAKETLALGAAGQRDMARCRGLFAAGQLGFFMGHHAQARRFLEESLSIARELEDLDAVAMVLQPLGLACLGDGDKDTARIFLEESLALAQQGTNRREWAAALNNLAQLHRSLGRYDLAAPLYRQALALAREFSDREYINILLLNLAIVAITQGELQQAGDLLAETFDQALGIQTVPVQLAALEVTACLCAVSGELMLAARMFGAAAQQSEVTGLTRDPSDEAFVLPQLNQARQALGPVAWAEFEEVGRKADFDDIRATARNWLKNRAAMG
jgi:tetratricopeptide (TPR) repeat protein